jgi:hypothetical protein
MRKMTRKNYHENELSSREFFEVITYIVFSFKIDVVDIQSWPALDWRSRYGDLERIVFDLDLK